MVAAVVHESEQRRCYERSVPKLPRSWGCNETHKRSALAALNHYGLSQKVP